MGKPVRELARSIAVQRAARPASAALADAYASAAVASARERQARADADLMRQRVREVEGELCSLQADLLSLQVLRLPGGVASDEPAASDRAGELQELFAATAGRPTDVPSLVTVVIPVYEKFEYTARCLKSIALNWSYSLNPTIIVVDDKSPDGSARFLFEIPGVELLCNAANLGYLYSSNRGAALARTKYVCFLNNDVEVGPAWLDWLVTAAEEDETIGAVGSKLIYPDGTLQEAGSIVWSDATGWNYGRGDDPSKSEYNFRRDVDYCSAASLLVRTKLLQDIGGFDSRYAPAYYEDADLCFEIRRRGYRVVYEPRSEVIHHEGISSGTDTSTGIKRYQAINQKTFAEKWRFELEHQFAPSPDNVIRARSRKSPANTVLIIDSYVPMHDREAGSNRLFKVIKILLALEYHVIFMPDNFAGLEPYTSDLMRLGVQVLYRRSDDITQEKTLLSVLPNVSIAWICRPELCKKYLPTVRENSSAVVFYDTIDLHFVRERRRAELERTNDEAWRDIMALELECARGADATITVSSVERDQLVSHGIENVMVVPTIHDVEEGSGRDFELRHGLVFIGGYSHTPNVDAANWLCKEIMPIVWSSLPDVRVTLLGNNPPPSVRDLSSDRVLVTGFIADVAPFFDESRVFVAPVRYGAGMKGKIGQALSHGLPVVTTSVGVEGFDLVSGVNCTVADDPKSFAGAILEVYNDPVRWNRYSRAGRALIAPLGSSAISEKLSAIFAGIKNGRSTLAV